MSNKMVVSLKTDTGTLHVMVIVIRNGINEQSSNPGQGCLHSTFH